MVVVVVLAASCGALVRVGSRVGVGVLDAVVAVAVQRLVVEDGLAGACVRLPGRFDHEH
jgi:hypothetical protein